MTEYKKLRVRSWDHLKKVSRVVIIDGEEVLIAPSNACGLAGTNIMYDETFEYLYLCAKRVLEEREQRGTTITLEEFEKPYIDEDFN